MSAQNVKVLLLCGGQSSRMGTPKHLLPFGDGRPIHTHLLERIVVAVRGIAGIYISLHDPKEKPGLDALAIRNHKIKVLYDDHSQGDIGPAAGLIAAYTEDPTCDWLVIACDYPLISVADISRLFQMYQRPLTCLRNAQGWAEPLLAVWSPSALQQLRKNVESGHTGPKNVLKQLDGQSIEPLEPLSVFNANTPVDWEQALSLAKQLHLG